MGILRVLLALTVLNWHYPAGGLIWFSFISSFSAVFVFFIISGFYMAMVITEKYGNDASGMLRFYGNRAIRIYPVYLVVLFACDLAGKYDMIGRGLLHVLGQALIFPSLWPGGGLYLGQMSTVALELLFYAIAPFIVLRRLRIIVALFIGAVLINTAIVLHVGVPDRSWQYDFFPAISVYFLAGILAYRLYTMVRQWPVSRLIGYAAFPLILFLGWLTPSATQAIWTNDMSVYAYYVATAVLIPFLFSTSKSWKLDRMIGDLSYPLYIAHVPAIWTVQANPWLKGGYATAAVFLLSMAFSAVLLVLVDRPLQKLRERGTTVPKPSVQQASARISPQVL